MKRFQIAFVVLAAVLAASCGDDVTAPAQKTLVWTAEDAVPDTFSCYVTEYAVVDDVVYAIDVYTGNGFVHVYAYDPGGGTWTEYSAGGQYTLFEHPMVAAMGRVLYVMANSRLLTFDVDSKEWGEGTSPPVPAVRGAAASLDGYLYVVSKNSLQRYTPQTDQWTVLRGMPTGRTFCTAAAVQGAIYVVGGFSLGATLATVEAYDPATDAWTEKAPLPLPRGAHASVVSGDRMLILGGNVLTPESYESSASVVVYDPATDRWEDATDMAQARYLPGAVAVGDDVLCIGGCTPSGSIATMERGTWQ
jgi:hypothetical protein